MMMFIRPIELPGLSFTKKVIKQTNKKPVIAIGLCFRRHESISKPSVGCFMGYHQLKSRNEKDLGS